jgi:hypothetical protein
MLTCLNKHMSEQSLLLQQACFQQTSGSINKDIYEIINRLQSILQSRRSNTVLHNYHHHSYRRRYHRHHHQPSVMPR